MSPALSAQPTIDFAQASDPGRDPSKQVNEDACGYASTAYGHLIVLCDGMGGHHGGREASRTAIETIFACFERAGRESSPALALKTAIEQAGQRVYALGGPPENMGRPGSTVVAMVLHAGGVDVAHVGDSRAYVIRAGQIYPLTRDHSVVQGMVDAGLLTEAQAQHHPDSNQITRALGMSPEVQVDVRPESMELFGGDILITASDGLTDLVLKADILETVRANVEARGLEFTTQLLVALANERGGHDNITVQAARVVDSRPRPTALPAASSATLLQSPAATTIGSNTLFEDADTSDWRRRPSPTIDAGHASVGATLRTAPLQPTWSATPPPTGTALGGPPTIGQAHGRTAFDVHKRRGLVYLVIGLALLVMALAVALLWSISNHHAP